jgi:hypothetical protein
MALTVAKLGDSGLDFAGLTPFGLFTLTGDTSYPAGGYPITPGTFGLDGIHLAGIIQIGASNSFEQFELAYQSTLGTLQVAGPDAASGTNLTLGAVTGTSTLSAATSANLVTVTAPNSLIAPCFAIFQGSGNGNIAKANGQLVYISAATATTFSFTWAGIGGTVASAADTTALAYPVVTGAGGATFLAPATGIPTTTVLTSDVGTFTVANTFVPGQLVLLQGLTNAATLNGYVVQVLTASATAFTFNLNIANVTTGSETTGSVAAMVTQGRTPIITGSPAAVTNSVLTSNVVSLSAVQNFPVNTLVMIQGLTNGAALNGYTGAIISTSLTNALFKYNFNHANISTGADAGAAAPLIVGAASGASTEITAGTNLSTYSWTAMVICQR